jgi:prefoldin beta subunit
MLREQINVFERSTAEIKATIKSVDNKEEEEEVYKQVGLILFKDKVGKVIKDLQEKLEISNLQLNSLKKQEENMKKKLKAMENELTTQVGTSRDS